MIRLSGRSPLCLGTVGSTMAALLMLACSNPASPSVAELFSWTDEGLLVQASSNGREAARFGGTLSLAAGNCDTNTGLNLAWQDAGLGTHPITNMGYFDGSSQWIVGSGFGGSGSVLVRSLPSERVAGSFVAEMVPLPGGIGVEPGGPSGVTKSITGSFDLVIESRTLCFDRPI